MGFIFFNSAKGFDHLIQATVLDAEGKVYRQIYGMAPEPPALVEPLKELLYGKQVAASPMRRLMNNINLFCTVYDPATGRYHFDYSLFVASRIGLLMLGGPPRSLSCLAEIPAAGILPFKPGDYRTHERPAQGRQSGL